MRASPTAGTSRSAAVTRRPADRAPVGAGRAGWRPIRWIGGAIRLLARVLARRRRSRRASLQSWMSMDPRVLADIGVTRADVQAVLYAGVPIERLGARRATPSNGEVVGKPCRPAPRLRLGVSGDLNAAA